MSDLQQTPMEQIKKRRREQFSTPTVMTKELQKAVVTDTLGQKQEHTTKELGRRLLNILADLYVLRLKTEQVHWNVEGPYFAAVHDLTEQMYTALAEAIDDVAERIRAKGFYVPANFKTYETLSVLEFEEEAQAAKRMLQNLADDRERVVERLKAAIEWAQECEDEASSDLLTTLWQRQEKYAWMMNSLLGQSSRELLL